MVRKSISEVVPGCFKRDTRIIYGASSRQEAATPPQKPPGCSARTSKRHFSLHTIRRALQSLGMKACVKKKKPLLSKKHRMTRLDFADRYWEGTSMTGSGSYSPTRQRSTFWGSDGRHWCWKEPGTALRPYQVKQTVKHGGGNLMAWGAFMANGVGGLALIENRMNAALYCKIYGRT